MIPAVEEEKSFQPQKILIQKGQHCMAQLSYFDKVFTLATALILVAYLRRRAPAVCII